MIVIFSSDQKYVTIRKMSGQVFQSCDPLKLAYKINPMVFVHDIIP